MNKRIRVSEEERIERAKHFSRHIMAIAARVNLRPDEEYLAYLLAAQLKRLGEIKGLALFDISSALEIETPYDVTTMEGAIQAAEWATRPSKEVEPEKLDIEMQKIVRSAVSAEVGRFTLEYLEEQEQSLLNWLAETEKKKAMLLWLKKQEGESTCSRKKKR